MDGVLHVPLVLDVDDYRRALLHLQDGARNRAVIGQHPHPGVPETLGNGGDPQLELVAVRELDQFSCADGGKALDRGRKML
jgi:hypothetical protein